MVAGAYGDGESGSIFVSNVLFDDSAGAYAIEVVVPVREKSGENGTWVVGILRRSSLRVTFSR